MYSLIPYDIFPFIYQSLFITVLLITCPPGLAQITKRELKHLGYDSTVQTPSLLTLEEKSESDIAFLNLRLRTANRVSLVVASERIINFDDLFAFVYTQERNHIITKNQKILISAKSSQSQLSHTPSIQSLSKKAIIKKLTGDSGQQRPEDKSQGTIFVEISLVHDQCIISLNSSGDSLHRRGYRTQTGDAPLKETIAAGLILSSGRRFHEALLDPCCGSGTIPIEAAMIAKNIAPGLHRSFAFEDRTRYDTSHLKTLRTQAEEKIMHKTYNISGSDIDPEMITIAQHNAKNVGVEDIITRKVMDLTDLAHDNNPTFHTHHVTLLTNPPYGKRLSSDNMALLYETLIMLLESNTMTGGFITNYQGTQEQLIKSKGWKSLSLKNGSDDAIFWKTT